MAGKAAHVSCRPARHRRPVKIWVFSVGRERGPRGTLLTAAAAVVAPASAALRAGTRICGSGWRGSAGEDRERASGRSAPPLTPEVLLAGYRGQWLPPSVGEGLGVGPMGHDEGGHHSLPVGGS